MLSRLGSILYPKIFIIIIKNANDTVIYARTYKKNKLQSTKQQKFDTKIFTKDIYDFIQECIKDSPYYYVCMLDPSIYQGAIPTCKQSEMDGYYDKTIAVDMCYDDKWAYYTSKFDMDDLQRGYKKVGIDLIFSPFVVLAKFFEDKIDSSMAMYALVQDSYLTLCVFNNGKLSYAEHIFTQEDDEEDDSDELVLEDDGFEETVLDDDDSIDLDEIGLDEFDSMDEFGDIEELDSLSDMDSMDDLEELDGFSDIDDEPQEMGDEENEPQMEESEELMEHFSDDYKRFLAIQSSIKRYYSDERYESEFLETIYIADTIGVGDDLKGYLEEEMFLKVFVRHMEISEEISKLAKSELK